MTIIVTITTNSTNINGNYKIGQILCSDLPGGRSPEQKYWHLALKIQDDSTLLNP